MVGLATCDPGAFTRRSKLQTKTRGIGVMMKLPSLRPACGLALAALIPFGAMVAPARADLPASVEADYEITYNGLKVGGFSFRSDNAATSYKMTGAGKVSVLFGAFKWNGNADASGGVTKNGAAEPRDFKFDLKGKIKGGTTTIAFDKGAVAKIDMTPPPKPKPEAIPVEPQHLRGVFDPMSAVMMMTRGGDNPCSRKVPVFDGQRRLDVTLSPQGEVPLKTADAAAAPGGAPQMGLVCRVNYKLIAGHKPGDENTYMNKNQSIEMVLRPVPAANVYVPYEISASTLLGTIRVQAKKVTIQPAGPGKQQVVLLH